MAVVLFFYFLPPLLRILLFSFTILNNVIASESPFLLPTTSDYVLDVPQADMQNKNMANNLITPEQYSLLGAERLLGGWWHAKGIKECQEYSYSRESTIPIPIFPFIKLQVAF